MLDRSHAIERWRLGRFPPTGRVRLMRFHPPDRQASLMVEIAFKLPIVTPKSHNTPVGTQFGNNSLIKAFLLWPVGDYSDIFGCRAADSPRVYTQWCGKERAVPPLRVLCRSGGKGDEIDARARLGGEGSFGADPGAPDERLGCGRRSLRRSPSGRISKWCRSTIEAVAAGPTVKSPDRRWAERL